MAEILLVVIVIALFPATVSLLVDIGRALARASVTLFAVALACVLAPAVLWHWFGAMGFLIPAFGVFVYALYDTFGGAVRSYAQRLGRSETRGDALHKTADTVTMTGKIVLLGVGPVLAGLLAFRILGID